jgi:hypothetical protein
VTAFEYQLHSIGSLLGGMVLHPFAKAAEVLRFYRDFTSEAPDELTAAAGVLTGQDGQLMVGIVVSYCGSGEEPTRLKDRVATEHLPAANSPPLAPGSLPRYSTVPVAQAGWAVASGSCASSPGDRRGWCG